MKDEYGRKINYLRISLTDKCNLRCIYCMPPDIEFDKNYINNDLSVNDYKFLIKSMATLGITKIKFTGGEPLLHPSLCDLVEFASKECNIKNIGITTNGIGLDEIAYKLKDSGLTSANINLTSLKEYKYKTVTRGGLLKNVLKSIDVCLRLGIKVKINCTLIDGFNDDEIYDFMELTKYSSIDLRFVELMPLGEAKRIHNKGYINTKNLLDNVEGLFKLGKQEDSSAYYYKFKGAKGRVGVISSISDPFCEDCNKIIITNRGTIKLCLNSGDEVDIKRYLNKPLLFREEIKDIILKKPKNHRIVKNGVSGCDKCMYEIGG
ncbi:GTP 3',8-cyclase MoaA [Asaccharospora irregularis]|uniref:GTP 3',8-cyclase n=1 Tax=Asaccharospora irregularis DSM 2635 TaxID=1121321 RepID=A0A1M5PFW1_9FIRM|nr:GTP 3',8-cyclase MoaA [Asaccharospora irregularis]SHH00726.1 cyclic pyranopterin monophosphate synthase subunit MoaA [Asaccharospora irregularis DSM 2635]